MSNYKFLINKDSEENVFRAIDADRIETLRVSETYDQYGQRVSPEDAGACLYLLTEKACEVAKSFHLEQYEEREYRMGEAILAYEDKAFDEVVDETEEGEDYERDEETCEGFNYWDGSNWQTVVIKYNQSDYWTGWEIVDDEELEKKLNQAIEDMEFESEGGGFRRYTADGYEIEESFYSSSWESYSLRKID
ncbi:hypothetical protein SAMN05443429_10899 [Cruoricaptor ignavus]|uniref:Uncharacterized protein n=1 Tax=Cruoricaptor ignavus TaxID=1118202 RepID=A0A1M6G8N4_9FLAO|nr:hypothetical protein [Cruoricaptor ignavus]SHJ06330.1 hypothetical protein SAMN05443429_10899 [Cruoricaptor ignavus]